MKKSVQLGTLPLVMDGGLVSMALIGMRFGRMLCRDGAAFSDGFRTGHKRRKAFKKLVEHFAASEKFLNGYADFDTIIAGLFKGAVVAVRGHVF
jgi:hypothetical protein